MSNLSRIAIEPEICGGRPTIRGTRMRVSDILGMLAGGATHEGVLTDFPYLKSEDIAAALEYASAHTSHQVLKAA